MAFPENYSGFMHDMKTLVQKRPIVSSTLISVTGLVAIATIVIPSIQRFVASDDSSSSASNVSEDLSDGEINAGNTLLSDDDIRIGADIDSLEVLLSEIDLESEELEDNPDRQEPSQPSGQRSPSTALLNPVNLANESTRQRNGNEAAASMYAELFSPINVQSSPPLEATVLPILPGNVASTDVMAVPTAERLATPSSEFWGTSMSAPTADAGFLDENSTEASTAITESSTRSPASSYSQSQSAPFASESSGLMPSQPNPSVLQPSSDALRFQTSPLPGTTGYTIPDALRSPLNPYILQQNPQAVPSHSGAVPFPTLPNALMVPQSGVPQEQPMVNFVSPTGFNTSPFFTPSLPTAQPTYTVPQNTFALPPAPSTRPPRFNGGGRGGEFNTFSNP
jgi:hypothetical protein